MATTLTNGYILPEDGDRGSTFFPALESNIQRVNDHNHNGANSEKLTSESFIALTDTINPGDWALQANGLYRASVLMPGSLLFDTTDINLRTNNRYLYADIEKITSNTFYVYVNDNTLTVSVVFG
jgi:hypothetical protein